MLPEDWEILGSVRADSDGRDHVNRRRRARFTDGEILSIRLQARPENYCIDNLVLILKTKQHKLTGCFVKSKNNLTFSSSDETFIETIKAAWEDFNASDRFDIESDQVRTVFDLVARRPLLKSFSGRR